MSEKIDTKFEIDKLYLTFSGNLTLEKLLLEDQNQDTLLYTKYLEANVPLSPSIFGDEIKVDFVDWKGLKANVKRKDSIRDFNYQFIIDAFASEDVEKQTANNEKPPQISIGQISFSDFDLTFDDQVSGINTTLKLGQFNLKSQEIDLENMKFHLSEVHLSQTNLSYIQTKSIESEDTNESSTLPWIIIDQLDIDKTNLTYTSIPEDIQSKIQLEKFSFLKLNADLNVQDISLENLSLQDSQIGLALNSNSEKVSSDDKTQEDNQAFSWPEWEVSVAELDLGNNIIEILQYGKQPDKGQFSPEAIALTEFNFNAENLELSKDENLSFNLDNFQFKDKSGLDLKVFEVNTKLNNNGVTLNDIRLKVNNSLLYADLKLDYKTIQEFINSPDLAQLNLDVNEVKIDLADAYLFSPELRQNPNFKALTKHQFAGNFNLTGNLNELQVPKFDLKWGKNTSLTFNGNLSQVTDVDKIGVDLKNYRFKSSKVDISEFISEDDLGISIPKSVVLLGNFRKNGERFSTQSELQIPEGSINLDGHFTNANTIEYDLNLIVNSLKLGDILQNPDIGELSMTVNSDGKGNTIESLTAQFSSTIDSIRYRNYTFSEMALNGKILEGKGDLKFDYDDDNLKFNILSKLDLDKSSSQIDTEIDLEGIRTQKFGLSDKDLRARVLAKIQFKGNPSNFSLDGQFTDGLVIYDDVSYNLGKINFTSLIDSTRTRVDISSPFLNLNLDANASIENSLEALQNHFKKHFETDFTEIESVSKSPVKVEVGLDFIETPILSEVFIKGIQKMDTLKSNFSFDEEKRLLTSSLNLPYFNFNDNEINGLRLNLNSGDNAFTVNFGFDNIKAGPLDIAQTEILGEFKNQRLDLNLKALKDDKVFFNSSIATTFEEDELYRIKVSPDSLVLSGLLWSIPENNQILYQKDSIQVSDFVVSRKGQEIKITDDLDLNKSHVGLAFKNFKLSSILNYFNPDEALANGDLQGDFIIIEPFSSNGLVSNLKVDNLKITQVPLGNLKLKAVAVSEKDYKLDLSLKDAGIDFDAEGLYDTKTSQVDFDVALNKLEMKTIEDFATDYIKDANGVLNGEFKINGDLNDLDYDGFLAFKDATFNLKSLNSIFVLEDEKLSLNKNKIIFNDFKIENADGNSFKSDGNVTFEDLTNPIFDLQFEAQDFQVLNTTQEDNDLYFGKLVFDAKAKLKGDLNVPKLNLDLTVKDVSDLTYIIPETQASIEERDGIVVFVNKENPNDILTQPDDKAMNAIITGVDLKSNIKIQNQSKINIILDKRTGDHVNIQGGGDFKFDMTPTGNMNLVGLYNVTQGSVELNFYNIVKRKFEISPTSSVSWNGNPYDADLDIRAIYKIETSASSLMASQTAGENVAIRNSYKQKLPFLVFLDVNGELSSPVLSFKLDMPEEKQGAINGSVYGRVNQVNQQDDLLNRQVFSLLVLNKFYPESGSDGSQGGAASLARENINQALSDQLNAFSDKLTKNTGISLNFDLNSYTDYQSNSAQNRTDLDVTAQKKLMDDRLVVEAGSQMNVEGQQRPGEGQAVIGNVSVDYLLTEDGRWKIRGFRKSEYENVIDGQVFISGIALIFTREFNKFRVLWDKAYRESLQDEQEQKIKSE